MLTLRSASLAHPVLAVLTVLAALTMRIMVPAGFMPTLVNGSPILTLCSGYGPVAVKPAPKMSMPMHDMAHHDDGEKKAQSPCAFADLSLPAIGTADPIQLAAALRYILTTALLVRATPPRTAARLRPPLRGPPILG